MFINKLNQLYKPGRRLYYRETSEEEVRAFCDGELPEDIGCYANAFGTYDCPGVFYLKGREKPVIGIEYRPDDERVRYPEGMAYIDMEPCFFYSVEIDNDSKTDLAKIRSVFETVSQADDAHRMYSDFTIAEEPEVVGIFGSFKKLRVLYECLLVQDRAGYVITDDATGMRSEALYDLAFFDPITGHHNWNHLLAFLEMPMDDGIDDFAFVHFDIKEFRVINEVYGHIVANVVLSNVVRAMKEADFVYASARCHNDNFAMMIRDMPEADMIATLEDFFEGLSHLDEDPSYRINYRCGVVPMQRSLMFGNRVADAGKLAQSMGTDMNRTEITVYTDKMHDDISWGNYIKAYLETAIGQDEFVVYLQPKVDIHTEEVCGAEALIRWNYKQKEFLSPGRFIPFFEKDGSIGRIDDIVLDKVCHAMKRWADEGKRQVPVSVNLSRSRLYDPNLIGHLTGIVDKYGVDHGLIDFELTESATYDNRDHMIAVLEELRAQGFRISMDDFGTGYSSLSLLTEMPLDTLKIDKSFVDKVAIPEEKEDDIIVIRHIITLAGELGFESLAEGAESREQVDRLRELGCEIIQGYYFSKPIPMEEFEEKYLAG